MTGDESWRNIGKRIRKLRKDNGLTLKQLAAGCDLSPNAISLVERGEVAPTVITLCKIAHALGAPASSFFQEVCPLDMSLTRAAVSQSQCLPENVLQVLTNRNSSPPCSNATEEDYSLMGRMAQMVLCVSGPIIYEVDDQGHQLNPGDSLTFNGEAFHRWRNAGEGTAVAVMVLTPENRSCNTGG